VARKFAVSFDYRCPFARNGHESVVQGLRDGRDWDVRFVPFSLDQVHVEEGAAPVWDREPDVWGTGVNALLWGIAVRDSFADHFLDWHVAAFAARHDEGRQIAKPAVLAEVATSVGLDADAVAAEVASGRPLKVLAEEHSEADQRWLESVHGPRAPSGNAEAGQRHGAPTCRHRGTGAADISCLPPAPFQAVANSTTPTTTSTNEGLREFGLPPRGVNRSYARPDASFRTG
jgi:hypothetical protein